MLIGIVGGTGFIGSYLCRRLAAGAGSPLRLLIRNAMQRPPVDSAAVLIGDLLSRADCERFVSDVNVIYYLAHANTPVSSDRDQPTDAALNLVPFLNLLDAVRKFGAKPHIVYFSSGGAIYAPRPARVPFRETDVCAPTSSYGILKITAEQYLRLAAERGDLTSTVLRVGNAYGTLLPDYRTQGLIGVALNHLLHGTPVRIFGNPDNVRDYIHLDDVCDAALKAARPRRSFDVFNIGTGRGHSVNQVLAIIQSCYGAPFAIQNDAASGRLLIDWVVLDSTRANEELGWSPSVELDAGIATMLSALRSELPGKSMSVP